ncbi:hypothetical protein, conserved [Trypanosoma brucei gambiense DAL972]|uniref:Uncharacterized protein n=1 Tax=Trypanosoma brucei gambiense (strain MHOM/CI/86/DAL972) TaxID=679716 RepID=C9ZNU4_TRYB9|nr:hypothetical protein, conserved [Trypanosoma brucei gambiense DAL972]CBH11072.1 hypothetical protein, conserved [Trypanosoma brucei gambiense DAL972]|eukprot:XP_011773359.1 hypothetical protein, conserved [Trypanosoma brucei gambiense DAL972]
MSKKPNSHSAAGAESEEARVESFGRKVFEIYTETVKPSIFDLQLRHYADYLHHFGFSIERETKHLREAPRIGGRRAPARSVELLPGAQWGIGKEEREEADAWAREVGPLEGVTRPHEIVTRLIEPFKRVTWRQSASQCALKKARTLYCWLCNNINPELPQQQGDEAAASVPAPAGAGKKEEGNSVASSRSHKKKSSAASHTVVSLWSMDLFEEVLAQRRATCIGMAQIYQKFLQLAGIKGEVVEGFLRRRPPGKSIEWAWNLVQIPVDDDPPLSYLVDVMLSAHSGQCLSVNRPGDASEDVPKGKPNQQGESTGRKGRAAPAQQATPQRSILEGPLLAPFCSQVKRMEDFYFNTHPEKFFSTHFPKRARHSLLQTPKRKTVWEGEPLMTHDFFRFPLALDPSGRRCSSITRSTPFYIKLFNEDPEHFELCCVLFRGTLMELPDNCSSATALGPRWVWHQREESSMSETFTLMVPESGYYCMVIGARAIRKDPFSDLISEEPFVPVVAYQALVTFVANPTPQIPCQYFSPSICKLLEPLRYQVKEGLTRFIVMPSCANVVAVAVVLLYPEEGRRELLSFLNFSPKDVAYTGDITLPGYHNAEVWILYAAPDHDYVNTTGLPSLSARYKPKTVSSLSLVNTVGPSQGETAPCVSKGKMLFLPFVTNIEVKKLLPESKKVNFILPEPNLNDEQQITFRRLIGVTPELYKEAAAIADKDITIVGSYFTGREGDIEFPNV